MQQVDWNQTATLSFRSGGTSYEIRTGPLRLVIVAAIQGHEPAPEFLVIRTANGVEFTGEAIRDLA